MTDVYTSNRQMKRFELAVDGRIVAWVDYERTRHVLELIHTEVLPAFRGRGLAGDIVTYALALARAGRLRVVPTCAYVASFIKRHAEYQELVA